MILDPKTGKVTVEFDQALFLSEPGKTGPAFAIVMEPSAMLSLEQSREASAFLVSTCNLPRALAHQLAMLLLDCFETFAGDGVLARASHYAQLSSDEPPAKLSISVGDLVQYSAAFTTRAPSGQKTTSRGVGDGKSS